jgi:hypothetical protein
MRQPVRASGARAGCMTKHIDNCVDHSADVPQLPVVELDELLPELVVAVPMYFASGLP